MQTNTRTKRILLEDLARERTKLAFLTELRDKLAAAGSVEGSENMSARMMESERRIAYLMKRLEQEWQSPQ